MFMCSATMTLLLVCVCVFFLKLPRRGTDSPPPFLRQHCTSNVVHHTQLCTSIGYHIDVHVLHCGEVSGVLAMQLAGARSLACTNRSCGFGRQRKPNNGGSGHTKAKRSEVRS